jgi:hypothetical protein
MCKPGKYDSQRRFTSVAIGVTPRKRGKSHHNKYQLDAYRDWWNYHLKELSMTIQVRVTDNPCNIGNGFWHIGKVFDVVGETNCFTSLKVVAGLIRNTFQ